MAEHLNQHLYRVAVGSERNYIYVHGAGKEDLIRFLARSYPSKSDLFGATELLADGNMHSIPILDEPLLRQLYAVQEAPSPHNDLPPGVTIIDGRPWAVLLPAGGADASSPCLWQEAMDVVQNHKARLHQIDMFSWCQESPNPALPRDRILRGFEPCKRLSSHSTLRHNAIGYRPVIIPLDKGTLEPNSSFLLGHPDGTVFRFGSLYMGGKAQTNPTQPTCDGNIPSYIPGSSIQIGDSAHSPDQRISWLKVGNVLLSDRNLLKHISWDDLDKQGLARGPDFPHPKEANLDSMLSNAKGRAIPARQTAMGRGVPCM